MINEWLKPNSGSGSHRQLWNDLTQKGLIDSSAEMPISTPWYLKIIAGVAGWVSAILITAIIFLVMGFDIDDIPVVFTIGVVFTSAAWGLVRDQNSSYLQNFGVGLGVSGYVFLSLSIVELAPEKWLLECWWLMLIGQMILLPSAMVKFGFAFIAGFSLEYLLAESNLPGIGSTVLLLVTAVYWLFDLYFAKFKSHWRACAYGFTLSLLPIFESVIFQSNSLGWGANITNHWLLDATQLVKAAIVLCVVGVIMYRGSANAPQFKDRILSKRFWPYLILVVLLVAVGYQLHGLFTSLLILGLGFYLSNRKLFSIGVVFSLMSASAYYYFVGYSLLDKSFILISSGLAMLLFGYVVLRYSATNRTGRVQNES